MELAFVTTCLLLRDLQTDESTDEAASCHSGEGAAESGGQQSTGEHGANPRNDGGHQGDADQTAERRAGRRAGRRSLPCLGFSTVRRRLYSRSSIRNQDANLIGREPASL